MTASATARSAVNDAVADHALKNKEARDLESRLDDFDQAVQEGDAELPGGQQIDSPERSTTGSATTVSPRKMPRGCEQPPTSWCPRRETCRADRLTFRLQSVRRSAGRPAILGRMKTILVIDDERNIVELLRLYLEKEGWAVIAAGDGESSLELHRRHEPDLIILDVMLPKLDGLEVCRRGPPAWRHADSHAHCPRR